MGEGARQADQAQGDGEMKAGEEGSGVVLAVEEPEKWQMPVRLYVEKLTIAEAEVWMAKLRLIAEMAGRVIRDRVYNRNAEYCCVCNEMLRDGKPAGTVGYYDAVRNWIPMSYCNQGEMGQAMLLCKTKEDAIEREEIRAKEAARKALLDIRSKRAPI